MLTSILPTLQIKNIQEVNLEGKRSYLGADKIIGRVDAESRTGDKTLVPADSPDVLIKAEGYPRIN